MMPRRHRHHRPRRRHRRHHRPCCNDVGWSMGVPVGGRKDWDTGMHLLLWPVPLPPAGTDMYCFRKFAIPLPLR